VTETDAKARRLAVRVEIAEGPQTILGSVRFAGNTFLDDDALRASLPFKVGRPLDPFQIAAVENATQERYVTQGYIRARVNHDLVFNDSQTRADLVFHVEEGERYYVGDIFIRGNRLTKRHVIERELLFREGVPYNYNLVFRSEQALARLGFFKSAKIEPVTAGFEEKTIDLIVYVVERNSGHGAVGLGYNTVDGVQGSVEIGHRNLAGHGRQIDFTAQGFVRDARFRLDKHRMALSFLWPWIARIPLDGNVTASDQLREEAAFDATEFRLTLGVSTYFDRLWNYLPATKRLGGLLTLSQFFQGSLSWSREQSFVFNVDPLAGRDAGIRSGEVLLAYLSPSIVRNSRNDAFNPSGGSYNTIAAEWAAPFLGSTAYYVKVTGKSSWYFPLDRLLRFLPGSTFAFNVSAGWAMPIAPTTEVPVTKRFFLGGYTSLRGYDPAQVGPRGGERNEAVGGNFSAVANADFRLRIWNGIGMLLFADAGNVYPDAAAIDPADVRYSVGLGLRYITPVGPIAADYGFALDRREGADFGQFYFSIGNAF
jgi:outer membrane protein insertion porin family